MPPRPQPLILPSGLALSRALEALEAIALHLAAPAPAPPEAPAPAPEPMLVRHLGIEHLGRWIYLPGRPAGAGAWAVNEPTLVSTAGRLVGLRPADRTQAQPRPDVPGRRLLVIAQGSTIAELPTSVADPVLVAPREW